MGATHLNLCQHPDIEDSTLAVHNGEIDTISTPERCPLRKEALKIEIREKIG